MVWTSSWLIVVLVAMGWWFGHQSSRNLNICPIPAQTQETLATPPGWTSPDHAKTQRDAARRRAQKTQLMRRRRVELTPSNQDLDKAQNTQSKRRRRAELSPEDAQRRKAMDTLWRRRLNSARAAGRGRVLESMS